MTREAMKIEEIAPDFKSNWINRVAKEFSRICCCSLNDSTDSAVKSYSDHDILMLANDHDRFLFKAPDLLASILSSACQRETRHMQNSEEFGLISIKQNAHKMSINVGEVRRILSVPWKRRSDDAPEKLFSY